MTIYKNQAIHLTEFWNTYLSVTEYLRTDYTLTSYTSCYTHSKHEHQNRSPFDTQSNYFFVYARVACFSLIVHKLSPKKVCPNNIALIAVSWCWGYEVSCKPPNQQWLNNSHQKKKIKSSLASSSLNGYRIRMWQCGFL